MRYLSWKLLLLSSRQLFSLSWLMAWRIEIFWIYPAYLFNWKCAHTLKVFCTFVTSSMISSRKSCKTIAILGTSGIGKSSLFLVVLKLLLEDPTIFWIATRWFYFQMLPGKIWLYRHANDFIVERCEELDAAIPLFADMQTMEGSPEEHAGICLIFTSFRPSRYKELSKQGWYKVVDIFNSIQFRNKYDKTCLQQYPVFRRIHPKEYRSGNHWEEPLQFDWNAILENRIRASLSAWFQHLGCGVPRTTAYKRH